MTEPYLALYIPELLLGILEHLSVDDLMVAALVCNAWSAPAAETRWRTKAIRVSCLLAKLAQIKRLYHYFHRFTTKLAPKTPITQDHWNRFLERCANRVTILEIDIEVDMDSWELISTLLDAFGGSLCSDLTSLIWPRNRNYGTKNYRKNFDLLTMTKLQALTLTVDLTESAPLSHLAHRATQIREIVAPANQSPSISQYSLSYDLYHIVLRLRDPQTQVTSIQQSNGEAIMFPRLEEFLIDPSNDTVDDTILRSVMPALRSLEYRRRVMGTYTIPFLNGIIRTSPCLKSITLMANVPSSRLELVQHDSVRSLFFHNRYKLRSAPDAGDLELSTIARAFPKLRKLEIVWNCRRWSWSAIQMLGDYLPALRHLGFSMDVSISFLSEAAKVTVPILSLTSLEFKVLCIQSAAIDPFINYLAILCPNVRNMEVGNLLELVEVECGQLVKIGGDGRAFIKRFFDYKG